MVNQKPENVKNRISKTLTGKYVGEKSPTWNPNKTDEERQDDRKYVGYYQWRKIVFERDNYTCQKCGQRGGKLRAHHKESYCDHKNLRLVVENGVTLCKTCHENFHKKYGAKPNTAQLNEFLAERG